MLNSYTTRFCYSFSSYQALLFPGTSSSVNFWPFKAIKSNRFYFKSSVNFLLSLFAPPRSGLFQRSWWWIKLVYQTPANHGCWERSFADSLSSGAHRIMFFRKSRYNVFSSPSRFSSSSSSDVCCISMSALKWPDTHQRHFLGRNECNMLHTIFVEELG